VPVPALALVDSSSDGIDTAGNNGIATPLPIIASAVVNVLD
jgi:hypothetical protein